MKIGNHTESKTLKMVKEEETPQQPLNGTLPAADKEAEIREWSLPDALTKLILVRLHVNELIGLKLVSKPWCSLISSPDFISDHIKRSKSDPSNHLLLFHYESRYNPIESPPHPCRSIVFFLSPFVSVLGSANGLICIVGKSFHSRITAADIWILNPVTGHIMKLPPPPKSPTDVNNFPDKHGFGQAYFVFWWDSSTGVGDGEYKLARIVPKRDNSITTVASVWVSSSPETWNPIHVGFNGAFHRPSQFDRGCDIVVGDFAYWIVFDSIDRVHVKDMFVLSLGLKTLSLSVSANPSPLHPDNRELGSMFQKLAFRSDSSMFAANRKGEFVLAEIAGGQEFYFAYNKDFTKTWHGMCSFDYDVLRWINDVNGKTVFVIRVDPLKSECGIALFDIETGKAEMIKDFMLGHHLGSAHDFVGSLVSIKGFKPIEAPDDLSPRYRVIWPYPPVTSRMSGNYKMKTGGAGEILAYLS